MFITIINYSIGTTIITNAPVVDSLSDSNQDYSEQVIDWIEEQYGFNESEYHFMIHNSLEINL